MKQFVENQNIQFNNATMNKYVFAKNIFANNIDFLNKIKKALEIYALKAIATPFDVVENELSKDDLRKLRNYYLHYNAIDDIVNEPESNRIRGIIQP